MHSLFMQQAANMKCFKQHELTFRRPVCADFHLFCSIYECFVLLCRSPVRQTRRWTKGSVFVWLLFFLPRHFIFFFLRFLLRKVRMRLISSSQGREPSFCFYLPLIISILLFFTSCNHSSYEGRTESPCPNSPASFRLAARLFFTRATWIIVNPPPPYPTFTFCNCGNLFPAVPARVQLVWRRLHVAEMTGRCAP